MDPKIASEVNDLEVAIARVHAGIDLAKVEDPTGEEIERVKAEAAACFARADRLFRREGGTAVSEPVKKLGVKVEQLKEVLTTLREAPE